MPGAIAHHLNARHIWHGLGRGNRTLDAFAGRSGFRDRFLVYAGRAPFKGSPHQELLLLRLCFPAPLKWCPHQDSHLEPQPLEAAYAYSITPCGHEIGSSGWIRTNTAALTERHPTVRSPRILKWWTRTVTLRLLPGANRSCDFHTASPLELAVETGAAPAVSSLTRRRVCCYSSRPKNWTQGMELHQPRQAYETRQSTGSPCSFKNGAASR